MPVIISSTNIWDYPADVRVNTVNCVGIMGKGIALEFKRRYPEMFTAYTACCQSKNLKPGEIFYWLDGNKSIWNLATKNHWRNPSQYAWIEKGIENIASSLATKYSEIPGMRPLRTVKVALPALGCSNGGLDFEQVKVMVVEKLDDTPHEIVLFTPLK